MSPAKLMVFWKDSDPWVQNGEVRPCAFFRLKKQLLFVVSKENQQEVGILGDLRKETPTWKVTVWMKNPNHGGLLLRRFFAHLYSLFDFYQTAPTISKPPALGTSSPMLPKSPLKQTQKAPCGCGSKLPSQGQRFSSLVSISHAILVSMYLSHSPFSAASICPARPSLQSRPDSPRSLGAVPQLGSDMSAEQGGTHLLLEFTIGSPMFFGQAPQHVFFFLGGTLQKQPKASGTTLQEKTHPAQPSESFWYHASKAKKTRPTLGRVEEAFLLHPRTAEIGAHALLVSLGKDIGTRYTLIIRLWFRSRPAFFGSMAVVCLSASFGVFERNLLPFPHFLTLISWPEVGLHREEHLVFSRNAGNFRAGLRKRRMLPKGRRFGRGRGGARQPAC